MGCIFGDRLVALPLDWAVEVWLGEFVEKEDVKEKGLSVVTS